MTPDERRKNKCEAVMQAIIEQRSAPVRLSIRATVAGVADKHGISMELLCSRSRQISITRARHEAYYTAYRAGASLSLIGRVIDRDHTTILYGIRQHLATLEGRVYRQNNKALYCPDIAQEPAPRQHDPGPGKIALRSLTPEQREDIKREIIWRRAKGQSGKRIAREMRIHERSVRCLVDEEYRLAAQARNREAKRTSYKRNGHVRKGELSHQFIPLEPRVDPEVVAARYAEIPRDTRTPAQRLMGDPIPARSALAGRVKGVFAAIPTTSQAADSGGQNTFRSDSGYGMARV